MNPSAKTEVENVVKDLFDSLNHHRESILALWHPAANLLIHGEARSPAFLKATPSFVGFELLAIKHVDIYGEIASAKVSWCLKLPGSLGVHTSYFNLVQSAGQWLIVSQVDFGEEFADMGSA
jgi:hypothetical protein